MIVKVDACQCEHTNCGHVWLAEKNKSFPPKRCARCKKANWHNRPIIVNTQTTQTVNEDEAGR